MSINYNILLDKANRSLIREALKLVSGNECNFYISFYTNRVGVNITSKLHEKYPKKMGIVLQHQFNNLTVTDNDFSVELQFHGITQTIRVPFPAIEVFHDKNENFYLKLDVSNDDTISSFEDGFDDPNKIISIDKFLNQ